MELSQVAQLKEVSSASKAEQAIAEGWTLISIIATANGDKSYPTYILGKARDAGADFFTSD
ncbi:hypothetical protein [Pseudomonas sp. KCJK8670]|uniref:hypothetical protein n=1 Tax=Pseudomonas sp. KCJK8670 TaxID=3344558 RepID=UPI003905E94F